MAIGFIGCGNMASAIISGMIESKSFNANNIYVYDVYAPATDGLKSKYNINICKDEIDLVENCNAVILAIKPNVISSVLTKVNNTLKEKDVLIISIAAGKSIEYIRNNLTQDNKIIRVMPNINAKVQEAICAYTANSFATDADKQLVENIFNSVGKIMYLDESYFPLFGVIGGCTPAFAYMFIDAIARAGVKSGMKKDVALTIAAQSLLGSAKMVLNSTEHPWELVDKVCSPGGTTIEGVTSLQADGFETAIQNAVDAALDKDSKL